MKKYLFSVLVSLAFCVGATAQAISVADVEALATGETVSFNLHITGVEGMTSAHFEFVLPETFTISSVAATSAWPATFSENSGKIGAMSPSANAFSGEGDIAVIALTVPTGTAVGKYPVTVNNIRVNGTTLETTATFNVNVVTAHTVILDENSETAPEDAEGVNVQVKRTINANEWSTICLPFDMTEEQIETAFPGITVQLGDFTGCEATYDEADENVVGLTLKFESATTIEANHPYIIKVSKKVEAFTVNGVDIEAEEEPSVDCDEYRTGSGTKKDPYVYHYNSFIGTYTAQTVVPELTLFVSGNKFWYSAGATTMKAFRGYFDFYDVLTEVEDAASRIAFCIDNSGDETTGIKELDDWTISPFDNSSDNGQNVNCFNLQGQRLNKSQIANLKSRIIIVNGKKVIK